MLLRGINVGAANRIAMPALRDALTEAGYGNVRTYVQSGNILLDAGSPVEAGVRALLRSEFGLDVQVVSRTLDELAAAVGANPFTQQALENPKALQVTFRSEPVTTELVKSLESRAVPGELVAGIGRELYSWHPHGIARSKLALALTGRGEAATARNWQTVTALLNMASTDA